MIPPTVSPPTVSIDELAARYQVFLLDAYGVLVDGAGALPAASGMLDAIRAHDRELLIVTNDASRSPARVAARFQRFGLAIPADRIITSGSLLAPYFAAHGLAGARCMVLGPDDTREYVRTAGGRLAEIRPDSEIDAVVIGNHQGYPFLDGIAAALSATAAQLRRGREVALILPNPDVIFPLSAGVFGFTAGGAALLIETGLARLFPERAGSAELRFARLGKPHPPMFERARRLAGTDSLVMIGDQLQTDIAGANAAGIASALITGDGAVSRWRADGSADAPYASPIRPDYLLQV